MVMTQPAFSDRHTAGRALVTPISTWLSHRPLPLTVVGIARGGFVVATEVAQELDGPAGLMVVRRMRIPGAEHLVFGTATSGGATYLHRNVVRNARLSEEQIRTVSEREAGAARAELDAWCQARPAVPLEGRIVVVIDDGLVSGVSMCAAISDVRRSEPAAVVVAVPVAAEEGVERVRQLADEVIVAETLPQFSAICDCYETYSWISDEEMAAMAARRHA
jgi:predicted phosphoribosyltransferase